MKFTFRHTLVAVLGAAVVWLTALPASAAMSSTPAATPSVQSAEQADDIFDIRGPVHIEAESPWLPWTAAGIGVLAMAYTGWILLRRPRRFLPFELALRQLEKTRPLMQPETVQPFSLAVSEVVRAFIERSFPVRAAHQTTEEFLRLLTSHAEGPLAAYREELVQFLDQCDLAKFARWSLSPPEMETLFDSARRFIFAAGAGSSRPQPKCHAASVATTLSPAHS